MKQPLALGPTAVCIGSGPSLTASDCEAVRHLPAIVTNTTFRLCPWAAVLISADPNWWAFHGQEAARVFTGRRIGTTANATRQGATETLYGTGFQTFGNTGCAAIHLALNSGVRRLLLLGFDCQRSGGRSHHFGSHPAPLSDCKSIREWPAKFARVAALAQRRGVDVINCSRETVLTCFPRQTLEEALGHARVIWASEPRAIPNTEAVAA